MRSFLSAMFLLSISSLVAAQSEPTYPIISKGEGVQQWISGVEVTPNQETLDQAILIGVYAEMRERNDELWFFDTRNRNGVSLTQLKRQGLSLAEIIQYFGERRPMLFTLPDHPGDITYFHFYKSFGYAIQVRTTNGSVQHVQPEVITSSETFRLEYTGAPLPGLDLPDYEVVLIPHDWPGLQASLLVESPVEGTDYVLEHNFASRTYIAQFEDEDGFIQLPEIECGENVTTVTLSGEVGTGTLRVFQGFEDQWRAYEQNDAKWVGWHDYDNMNYLHQASLSGDDLNVGERRLVRILQSRKHRNHVNTLSTEVPSGWLNSFK